MQARAAVTAVICAARPVVPVAIKDGKGWGFRIYALVRFIVHQCVAAYGSSPLSPLLARSVTLRADTAQPGYAAVHGAPLDKLQGMALINWQLVGMGVWVWVWVWL